MTFSDEMDYQYRPLLTQESLLALDLVRQESFFQFMFLIMFLALGTQLMRILSYLASNLDLQIFLLKAYKNLKVF